MSKLKDFINRLSWDARAAKRAYNLPTYPVKEVYIHHSVTGSTKEESTWRNIQTYHMVQRNWTDIAYNFGVGQSGKIFEGRGWRRQGGATGAKKDRHSLSICAIGNFEKIKPTQKMLDAIVHWIQIGIERGAIVPDVKILAHKDVQPTLCCGKHLYAKLDYIRDALAAPKEVPKVDNKLSNLKEAQLLINSVIKELEA